VSEAQRWGIWIDIEGFSKLWSAGDLALRGLTHLTSLIFEIGKRSFPDPPDRLFAHQIGDSFYIASDFHEPSLDRCAAVAVALMRGVTGIGCVARAAISEGALGDYAGCRPPDVQASSVREGHTDIVALGQGRMTLQAILGQGIINAYTLDKLTDLKGVVLSIAAAERARLSPGFITYPIGGAPEILAIDWVHSASPLIDEINAKAGFGAEDAQTLSERLRLYISRHQMSAAWSEPTLRYAGIGIAPT
jgi:hypothetical protein